tara:strand:- start:5206 stop:5868 length:663 start_codon:yes stop_codon:yes gene_type:complete
MMNSTNFANVKRRVIRMGPRGGFFVTKTGGEKKPRPVARFRKAADGSLVKLTKANLPNVPEAIRPKRAAAAKATVARPRLSPGAKATKMFATIMNKGPRKVRKNKGLRRKASPSPNQGALLRQMNTESRRMAVTRAKKAVVATKKANDKVIDMAAKVALKANKQAAEKAKKAINKTMMVVSPGGTIYKSKRSMLQRKSRATKKNFVNKMTNTNPFAALAK